MSRAMLAPRERQRRHQALMDDWYSRATSRRADDADAAGVTSTPADAKNSPMTASELTAPGAVPAPVFPCGVVTVASYAQAQRWAVGQGICRRGAPMDLRAVNAARRALGLPGFALLGMG